MRLVRTLFAALAVSCALASCNKPASKPEAGAPASDQFVLSPAVADLEKALAPLRSQPFKLDGAKASDIAPVIAALPKTVSVKFEKQDFDAASGATVLSKVSISSTDWPGATLTIDELRLWGLNADLATARLGGKRLEEPGPLARRIEAKGVATVGLDKAMTKMMGAMMKEMGAGARTEAAVTVDKYDFTVSHVVLDNVALRPFLLKPMTLKADNPLKNAMPALQTYAAWLNAFKLDAALYDGMNVDFEMTEGGSKLSEKIAVATSGLTGMDGAGFAASVARNETFSISMSGGPFGDKPIAFDGKADVATMENLRLAKAAGYLATGAMPPRTETDLLSLGVTRLGPITASVAGKPLFEMKQSSFDGSGFYWLIPTKLSFDVKGLTYHIDNLLEAADKARGDGGPPTFPPEQIATLKKYGLDAPSLDMSGSWTWDPKAGGAQVATSFRLAGWDKVDAKMDAGFPSFADVSAQIPETGSPSKAQQQALSAMFSDKSLLRALSLDILDEGGVDKGFNLAADLMNSGAPKDQTKSAKALRDETVNMVNSQASEMKDNLPLLSAVMGAFGRFLATPTPLHIAINPAPPVPFGEFEKMTTGDGKGAIDRLNLTIDGKKP